MLQRRLILSNPYPPWLLAAYGCVGIPSCALHFDQGYAWDGTKQVPFSALLSIARNSPELVQWANGSWTSVPANTLAISDLGLQVYELRQNKCTNYNINPTDLTNVTKGGDAAAVLSVVDDTAALAAQGLLIGNGKVYKLDNSAGVGVALAQVSGQVGNTNTHTWSVYWRGTGSATLRQSGGGAVVGSIQALTTGFVRYSASATPGLTTKVLSVDAQAGAIVYFFANQLEEGAFATSPIVVAGAAASRSADVVTLTKKGITRVVFTYGDNTTATVTGIDPATFYTIPTNQKGYKRIAGYAN